MVISFTTRRRYIHVLPALLVCIPAVFFSSTNGREEYSLALPLEESKPNSRFGGLMEESTSSGDDQYWNMVKRNGNQFVLNGQPFYINGFNTYWLMFLAVDQSTRGKVSEVLELGSSAGLTVCRTWAFNDGGWRALQKSPSVYDEQVFKALDFVVSEARKYKIRLIMTLSNNWNGFGGKAQYVSWGKEAGHDLTSEDDFYTDQTVRGYFKNHVKTVLYRVNTITNKTYKDDPTIFAWELMNEPQCPSDPSGDKLQAWIQEMAVYVKSIDPFHLLGTGLEGFYSSPERLKFNPNSVVGQLGTDFIRNHKATGIDFASVHIYPDLWISNITSDTHLEFVKNWMQTHIDDADRNLRMPVMFGEFGVSSRDIGFSLSFRDDLIQTVYSTLLGSVKKGGSGGGSLLWQLFPEGTKNMDDGYAVVPSKSPTTMQVISLQSRRVQLLLNSSSRCSSKCKWGSLKNGVDKMNTQIIVCLTLYFTLIWLLC